MKVLIIEDERDLAEAVAVILEKNNFTVEHAFDGEFGLDCALTGIYDFILLDIMLPKIDGLLVLKKMRSAGVQTPVLMLTARGEIRDKVAGLDSGADDYLPKPFHADELLARLRALSRRKGELFIAGVIELGTVEFTTWKNDKKNGAWYSIYENGYVEATYKDSKLEGLYKDYYVDGKIKEQGYYSNGEKDSGWDYYAENGSKLRFESWREGVMRNRVLYIPEGDYLKSVSIFDIAYFYKQANNAIIVTSENEKITYDKPFETLQELLGTDHFLLLNQKSMIVVNQNALKEPIYGKDGQVIGVITKQPVTEINITLDENGQKAVKAFFLPDIED